MGHLTAAKYYGGKARVQLNRWLQNRLPYEHRQVYVEPFAGMLGVLLNRKPAFVEIVNDLNNHIFTFWRVIRDCPDALKHKIQHTFHCRQTYDYAMNLLHGGDSDKEDLVEQAWAVYIVLEHSLMHELGDQWGWVKRFARRGDSGDVFAQKLDALRQRMMHVQIEHIDAIKLLERTARVPNALIYCDPPYPTADTSPYQTNQLDIDQLSTALKAQRGKVAISGYRDEWDHLGWEKHTLEVPFTVVDTANGITSQQKTECLWVNYIAEKKQQTLFD